NPTKSATPRTRTAAASTRVRPASRCRRSEMTRRVALLVLLALALVASVVFRPRHAPGVASSADGGAEPVGLEPHPIHEVRNEDFHGGNHYLVRNLVAGPIQVECR